MSEPPAGQVREDPLLEKAQREDPPEEGWTEERTHETHDVNVRGIIVFGAALGVLCAISAVLLVWLFRAFENREASIKKSRFPLAAQQRGELPPAPRLAAVEKLVNDSPRLPTKATPEDFTRRIREAMQELEGNLPARQDPARPVEPPADAASGRARRGGGR